MDVLRLDKDEHLMSPSQVKQEYSLECSDAGNLVARMNHRRCPSLSPHEDNVDKVRCRRHRVHLFKVVNGHFE